MKTGNWTEGKIGAKIVKLTDRWIAVKIDNRIELRGWTALIAQTDQTDQTDRIDRIDQSDQTDQSDPDTTNSCGKT